MYHNNLADGGWKKLTFPQQMANVGSEIIRAINWKTKNKKYSDMAFERALELLWLTIDQEKNFYRLRELTRIYESLVDYFIGDNQFKSSDNLWIKYFFSFNYLAQNTRFNW